GAASMTRSGQVRSPRTIGRYGAYLRASNDGRSSGHVDASPAEPGSRASMPGLSCVVLIFVAPIAALSGLPTKKGNHWKGILCQDQREYRANFARAPLNSAIIIHILAQFSKNMPQADPRGAARCKVRRTIRHGDEARQLR